MDAEKIILGLKHCVEDNCIESNFNMDDFIRSGIN